MTQPNRAATLLRFGVFEADLRAGELRRNGHRLRLQEKPFQLLAILLERPGEVVSKEELQERLWPDVTVDADGGLNEAVFKLRKALDDSAQAPRYIETVPKRGYRFVAAVDGPDGAAAQSDSTATLRSWRPKSVYAIALLTALLLGLSINPRTDPAPLRRFHLQPADPVQAPRELRLQQAAISPNGSLVAWVGAAGFLWIQDLKEDEPRRLDEPNADSPFWSPNSDYVLFQSKGRLLKAPARGGEPKVLCKTDGVLWHGTVSPDATTVVYASGPIASLWEAPFDGGEPRLVLSAEEREELLQEHFDGVQAPLGLFPTFLPPEAGERVVIFGIGSPNTPAQRLMVLDMKTRERRLLPAGVAPAYAPSGHLLFEKGVNPVDLWAAPFSIETLEMEGEPFLVHRNAWSASVSQDGTLAYVDWHANHNQLVWRDRDGMKIESLGDGYEPRISPDGSRVAYVVDNDIWVYDRKQQARLRITTDLAGDMRPIWSPDGRRLVFSSPRSPRCGIWISEIERAGEPPNLLFRSEEPIVPDHWSSDGLKLAYHASGKRGEWHLRILTKDRESAAWASSVFSNTGHGEMMLAFHPQSSFVAYQSYISGDAEIYIEEFPRGGNQIPISSNRGIQARWRADGEELFYIGGYRDHDRKERDPGMYSVSIKTEPTLQAGLPQRLFSIPALEYYDVTADGKRFLISEPPAETPRLGIRLVQNWFEEFRKRQ